MTSDEGKQRFDLEDRLIDFAVRIIYVGESLAKIKVKIRNSGLGGDLDCLRKMLAGCS